MIISGSGRDAIWLAGQDQSRPPDGLFAARKGPRALRGAHAAEEPALLQRRRTGEAATAVMTERRQGPGTDADALATVTGWVTCRLVADHALLHCKRCGLGSRVAAAPRDEFLLAVRTFIRAHGDCPT